jgi:hypothetical protein
MTGCSACWPEDAQAAWDADKKLVPVSVLLDESHFRVTLRACGACGQRFVCVFTETVDWVDSEDPQAWTRAPVSLEEAVALVGPAESLEARLRAAGAGRKTLRRDFPKGVEAPSAFWEESLTIGPHD